MKCLLLLVFYGFFFFLPFSFVISRFSSLVIFIHSLGFVWLSIFSLLFNYRCQIISNFNKKIDEMYTVRLCDVCDIDTGKQHGENKTDHSLTAVNLLLEWT